MTNIVKRDPFTMDNLFDDLMKGFFVRPMRYEMEEPEMRMVKMDVKENDGGYTVHAELPGVKKEDIHIIIEGNRVEITAETKRESERKEGEKVLHSERYYGKVSRGFNLAHELDEEGAKAHFENGVLELSLPKKVTTPSKKLMVE